MFDKGMFRDRPKTQIPQGGCYDAVNTVIVDGKLKVRQGFKEYITFTGVTENAVQHQDLFIKNGSLYWIVGLKYKDVDTFSKIGFYYKNPATGNWDTITAGLMNDIDLPIHSCSFKDAFFFTNKMYGCRYWTGSGGSTAMSFSTYGDPGIVFSTNSRLFVAGFTNYPSRVYWSDWLDYTSFGVAGTSSKYIDVLDDPTALTTGLSLNDYIYLFKTRQTYIMYKANYPLYFEYKRVSSDIGCTANRSLKIFRDVLLFMGDDGIYQMQGTQYQPVSDQINKRIKEVIDTDYFVRVFALVDKSEWLYHLFIPTIGSSGLVDKWFTLNLKTLGWTENDISTFHPFSGISRYETMWDSEIYIGDQSSGKLCEMDFAYTDDDGISFTPSWTSGVIDILEQSQGKIQLATLDQIMLEAESGQANVEVFSGEHFHKFTSRNTYTINLDGNSANFIKSNNKSRYFQFKLTYPDLTDLPEISKMTVLFKPVPGVLR